MITNGQALQTPAHLQIIANTSLFKGLPLDMLTAVLNQAQQYNFSSQNFIFHQYDKAKASYVILKGQVCLFQTTPTGKQVIINMLGAGDDMAILSVFEKAIYPLTAEAVTDCLLLGWSSQAMQQLMEQYPRIALNALKSVTGRFLELQNRYRELATERVEQRIAHALLRLSQNTAKPHPAAFCSSCPIPAK
ncbi:MAG TPA: Crp/Fnr family transcriptional regulator [Chromatiaceae bacterium]|nr:Crp/Fnr family transcriptional regulator [Chromatiaceae bacterium]